MSAPNLVEKLNAMFESNIEVYPARSLHASNIGHPCIRALVLDQVSDKTVDKHKTSLQCLFELGGLIGEQAVIDLQKALRGTGMRAVQQEQPIPHNKWRIGGRIDLMVINEDGKRFPVEVKSCGPYLYDSIDTMHDIIHHNSAFVRKYVGQIQIYMLMMNCDTGILLFRNRLSGEYKQIVCPLDLDYCESLLKKADKVLEHIGMYRLGETDQEKFATLPERIEFDPDFCESCKHFKVCLPDVSKSPSIVNMISDIELEAWCRIREQEGNAVRQYEEADEKISNHVKAVCEGKPVGSKFTIMTQSYYIKVAVGETTKYDLPEPIKAQYKKMSRVVRKTITGIDSNPDA